MLSCIFEENKHLKISVMQSQNCYNSEDYFNKTSQTTILKQFAKTFQKYVLDLCEKWYKQIHQRTFIETNIIALNLLFG